jgi:hypothetical protein
VLRPPDHDGEDKDRAAVAIAASAAAAAADVGAVYGDRHRAAPRASHSLRCGTAPTDGRCQQFSPIDGTALTVTDRPTERSDGAAHQFAGHSRKPAHAFRDGLLPGGASALPPRTQQRTSLVPCR